MSETAYDRVIEAFRREGCNVYEKGPGQAAVQAPGHTDADKSVSVTAIEGQVLVHSHSDPTDEVLDRIGITPADLFDSPKGVDYKYEDGRVVHRSTDKKFHQQGNTQGSKLYRASKLAAAEEVWFCEGEKDVHALESVGLVATTNAGGAGNIKKFDLSPLHGKKIMIIRDDDDAGIKHANELWTALADQAQSITVFTAAEGKDAADHIASGHTPADFVEDPDFRKRQVQRELYRVMVNEKDLDLESWISTVEGTIKSLRPPQPPSRLLHEWDDVVKEWWKWYDTPQDKQRVIPTPWESVDTLLNGGYHAGSFTLFGARPGVGKSIALSESSLVSALSYHPTLLLSLEMGRVEVASRILAAGGLVNLGQITRRELDAYNVEAMAMFMEEANHMPLVIGDTPNLDIKQMRIYIEQLKSRDIGLDMVCLDYAQLMKGLKGQRGLEVHQTISRECKSMSREFDVAIIAAVQINRDSVKEGGHAGIHSIRDSGTYEQDADVVCIMSLEIDEMDHLPTGTIFMDFAKNRKGSMKKMSMDWNPHHARIDQGTRFSERDSEGR
ncbi:DNA primase/ helicase [Gordonia Phage JonJames]|nr:DNA primase/ helicase [Gordonia Phage JonJames]